MLNPQVERFRCVADVANGAKVTYNNVITSWTRVTNVAYSPAEHTLRLPSRSDLAVCFVMGRGPLAAELRAPSAYWSRLSRWGTEVSRGTRAELWASRRIAQQPGPPYSNAYSNAVENQDVSRCKPAFRNRHLAGNMRHPDTPRHARDVPGGQVVAGSNPVSPTREVARQRRFPRNREPPFSYPPGVCTATGTATA